MRTTILAIAAAGVFVAGCATTPPAYLPEFEQYGVEEELRSRIANRDELGLDDITHLSEQGVPEETILKHLRETRQVFNLNVHDIRMLEENELSDAFIDYLLSTPTQYRPGVVYRYRDRGPILSPFGHYHRRHHHHYR